MLGNKKTFAPDTSSATSGKPVDTIDTLIGKKTSFKGDIEFSGGLRVDGKISGSIAARDDTTSTLVLSESSEVEGNVTVPHVIVNGTVHGNVKSAVRVELQNKARIIGDVHYKEVEMALGATINGSLVCELGQPDLPLKSVAGSAASSEKLSEKSVG